MTNYLKFNNISTILTTIFLAIFGALLGYLASNGINLPVTAETLTAITVGLIFLVFGYYNAKHHNDLFDKDTDTIYIPVDDLNEEQVDFINGIIEQAVSDNLGESDEP